MWLAIIKEVEQGNPLSVLVKYLGGDVPRYAMSQATREVLTALKDSGYEGDVLLHAFVLRATGSLSTVLDEQLSQRLAGRNIKGIAPDLANRRVNIVVFRVAGNGLQPANVTTSLPMPDILTRVLSS